MSQKLMKKAPILRVHVSLSKFDFYNNYPTKTSANSIARWSDLKKSQC